ncbi:MAG: pilus assembly protein PilM [Phycisphaerae bacterium]|nr:pilus assembly protein PilM [Phycisphaerae bacterium]
MRTALKMFKLRGVSSRRFTSPNMLKAKTVLGVSISEKQINLVLLKKGKNGIEILKSASSSVPEGAIKNGNIENAAVLARAIRKLKNSSKIRATRAAVLLFARPVITQIINIPRQVPSNVGQFVHDQMKDCAVLPGRKIALDYCGVSGAGSDVSSAGRLLITATDDRKIGEIVKMCGQADLVVESIEPALFAYTRALYAGNIAGKFDCNVLIAVLQDDTLTLCVFKKQAMDFVRTKSVSKAPESPYGEKTESEQLCHWLAEQINKVIQFYDVDVPDSCGKWEITVVAADEQLPENTEAVLKTKIASSNLKVLTNEDICHTAVVSRSADCQRADKPSPVALGLAMKLLETDAHNLGVNLLPQQVVRLRTVRKGALITANIVAALLLIMALAVNGPTWKIKKLNESINYKKTHLLQNTYALLRERALVNKQINTVSNKLAQVNKVTVARCDTDLAGILNDIGKRIPKTVCMTSLFSRAGSGISLKGLALSSEDVYLFVEMLNKSEYIKSASIAETKRDKKDFVGYEIGCTPVTEKGEK